jgi:O-antigen ligase
MRRDTEKSQPPSIAWLELTTSALLFLYPILLLTVREGVNVCFVLLLILASYRLTTTRPSFRHLNRSEIAFMAAMASLVIATAMSQIWHWRFRPEPYDGAGRFLLAIPIYLMLRTCQPETLTSVQYGIPLGAIGAALVVVLQMPLEGARASTYYMDAIRFGDLALVLGILSIISMNWDRTGPSWMAALKVVGLAAGVFASIESGTRGGWAALPAVALVWWSLTWRGKLSWRVNATLVGLLIVLALTSYFLVGTVHDRMVGLYSDLVALSHSDLDTSLGFRLQIWRVAIQLFAENPLFGIGPDEFQNVMPEMRDLGLLTSAAAQNGIAEVHSEILLRMVSLGILGLASIVSIHVVPLILFVRAARTNSRYLGRVASAGIIGACFVVSFLVFGLTIEIFNLKMIATFYSLTVAVLLAAAMGKEVSLKAQTG